VADIVCKPLSPELLPDYLAFFDDRAFTDNPRWAGCYCYFPLHDPRTTEWSKRGRDENRAAVSGCIRGGTARGVLAYDGGQVIGWCNAGPWSQYPMLADVPESDTGRLGMIFCFVVAPAWRGRGVARALLGAACDELRRLGMAAVQAKPLKSAADAAAAHLGPLELYLSAGFTVVRDGDDDDVFVRKALV